MPSPNEIYFIGKDIVKLRHSLYKLWFKKIAWIKYL